MLKNLHKIIYIKKKQFNKYLDLFIYKKIHKICSRYKKGTTKELNNIYRNHILKT